MPMLFAILWSIATLPTAGSHTIVPMAAERLSDLPALTAFEFLPTIRRAQGDPAHEMPREECAVADQTEPGENEFKDISKLSGSPFDLANFGRAFSSRPAVSLSPHPDGALIEVRSTCLRC